MTDKMKDFNLSVLICTLRVHHVFLWQINCTAKPDTTDRHQTRTADTGADGSHSYFVYVQQNTKKERVS